MLELVRKDMHLYTKVLMNIRLPIKYENKIFDGKDKVDLLLPEEVMYILARNGNILCWNGEKFVKVNLSQYSDIMRFKNYKVIDYVEPKVEVKKEEPKVEVKKEEPKEEPKVEVKKEEPKQQPEPEVKEEVVKEEQPKQYENKKQRHNNKQQGGDK